MLRIRNLILLALGLWAGKTAAQEPISLEEYRQRVLDYSYTLKTAREKRAGAYATARKNYTGYLPTLSADGDFSVTFPRRYANDGSWNALIRPYAFSLQPAIVQNVYAGGAVRSQYEQSRVSYDISLYGEQLSRLEVIYLAEYNYWNLASNEELLNVTARYEAIVRRMYEIIRDRFENGYVARTDLLMIENRLRDAEYSRINVRNLYRVSLQNFNILMGDDPGTAYRAADSILIAVEQPRYQPVEEVLQHHPDYRIAERQIDFSRYGVKLAAAKFNPRLVAGVQGIWNSTTPNFHGTTAFNGAAFLRLSVPIFHWGERRQSMAAERANLRAAEYNRGQVADNITRETAKAWTNIVESTLQIDIAKANWMVARENLDLNTFSYNEGQLTILDVISAQISWLQAYTNVVTSNFNQKVAISAYRKAAAESVGEQPGQ